MPTGLGECQYNQRKESKLIENNENILFLYANLLLYILILFLFSTGSSVTAEIHKLKISESKYKEICMI